MSPPPAATPHLTDKIVQLVDLMQLEMNNYDRVAATIGDRYQRDSVRLLMQQTTQYRNELHSLTQMLGRDNSSKKSQKDAEGSDLPPFNQAADEKPTVQQLGAYFADSEKKILGAYRDLLNEDNIPQEARNVIRQQLNGVTYCFAQLTLLRKEPV